MRRKWLRQKPRLGLRPYVWVVLAVEYAGMALLLFGAAGRLDWRAGWVFLGLFAISNTALCIRLERADPALVSERLRVFPVRGQPLWDRILFAGLFALIYAWHIAAGLEAGRYGAAPFGVFWQIAGALVMLASLWACYAVMHHNSYLAPTVRIQDHRHHAVVTTGPYAYVRHPFYAALIPFFFGGAALMGARWSLAVAVLIAVLLAVRCIREESYLAGHLEGYADYARTLRYRLVPCVW